eukprot:1635425-Amphidinium_carterae.1
MEDTLRVVSSATFVASSTHAGVRAPVDLQVPTACVCNPSKFSIQNKKKAHKGIVQKGCFFAQ